MRVDVPFWADGWSLLSFLGLSWCGFLYAPGLRCLGSQLFGFEPWIVLAAEGRHNHWGHFVRHPFATSRDFRTMWCRFVCRSMLRLIVGCEVGC